jgi:hypothetical protein
MKLSLAVATVFSFCVCLARADEQLFGFVRGAETLPARHSEVYQFFTLHEGKSEGTYYAADFETEYEYGFTDHFQASVALDQHYFYNQDVNGERDALDDKNNYRFGGVEASAKYRLLSPFKDPLGLALRLEAGYLINDEVDGLRQHDRYLKPEIDLQRIFWTTGLYALSTLERNGLGVNSPLSNILGSSHSKALWASRTASRPIGTPARKFTPAGNIPFLISTTSSIASFTPVRAFITPKRIGG